MRKHASFTGLYAVAMSRALTCNKRSIGHQSGQSTRARLGVDPQITRD